MSLSSDASIGSKNMWLIKLIAFVVLIGFLLIGFLDDLTKNKAAKMSNAKLIALTIVRVAVVAVVGWMVIEDT